jgi:hypothetical protein
MTPPTADSPSPLERDDIRTILTDTIRALDHAIDDDPPDSPDEEKRWLERMRTLRALTSEYRKLEKDRNLEEMADEIELLKDDAAADH